MFKKSIPVIAALSVTQGLQIYQDTNAAPVDNTQVQVEKKKHHHKKHRKHHKKESVPACTSYQVSSGKCENKDKVIDSWNVPTVPETHHGSYSYGNLAQEESVPACTSQEAATGKCANKSTATAPYDLPSDHGTDGW